jgi:hypothetical protein
VVEITMTMMIMREEVDIIMTTTMDKIITTIIVIKRKATTLKVKVKYLYSKLSR